MVGLEHSKWAPPPSQTRAIQHALRPASRADELERHRRVLRRLRWKLGYLADSHRRATAPDQSVSEAEKREAEMMFKLDFFEYYALLERALVSLLAVFGISVSGGGSTPGHLTPSTSSTTTPSPYAHRFHANVLLALDQPSNPLHEILGVGDVRRYLGAAKELRNRWKDAEEHALLSVDPSAVETASPPPLSAYEIEQMLSSIFNAFDRAQHIAEKAVREGDGTNGTTAGDVVAAEAMDTDDADARWEIVQDAMDWDEC